MNVYQNRVALLITKLKGKSALITDDINIYYYTGLWDSNGYFLVNDSQAYLFVDFRYGEVAEKTVTSAKVIVFKSFFKELNQKLSDNSVKELYCETNNVTLKKYKSLTDNISAKISDSDVLDNIINEMRIIKDEYEFELMKKAQEITENAFNKVLPMLKEGISEREIANALEYEIKANGAEKVSFDLITITGKKTSLPHGVPSNDKIKYGDFFTFDIGSTYKGYHSDMTRTLCVGEPSAEMKKVYDVVLKAHLKALSAVKAGIKACEIDKIARDYIYSEGYEGCFGHSTGHGVGLQIHEAPTVGPSGDVVLQKGMVITIEPGIYLKNKFGVRIEDTVIVTDNGCKSFASINKELTIL
jgi:Xaa-Pro aminopeptidase